MVAITKQFGQRARNEARQLQFGDSKLEKELESNSEDLVWATDRCANTGTGEHCVDHNRAL